MQSAATRQRFVASHADTGHIVLPAHFPRPPPGASARTATAGATTSTECRSRSTTSANASRARCAASACKVVLAAARLGSSRCRWSTSSGAALRDPQLDLTIVTALTLWRPGASSELEQRYAGSLVERLLFGDYREPEYVVMKAGNVPANVRVIEFYLSPARRSTSRTRSSTTSAPTTPTSRATCSRAGSTWSRNWRAAAVRGAEAALPLGSNP